MDPASGDGLQNRIVTPPTIRLGGRTTSSSSYTDCWSTVSRKKLRTARSISHLAFEKFMKGSDCRTCTSNCGSRPERLEPPDRRAERANALLIRYSTSTRFAVSGTLVSIDVDTS